MRVSIILTWSKLIATLILGASILLDLKNGGATAFMFALPFITVLVTGKQWIDSNNLKK